MANKNPIGFSARTFGYTSKETVKSRVLQDTLGSSWTKKEIARIFQKANRRIQNIEKKGIVSPAVVALNKGDIKGFTKFSMKHDLNDLKIEYSKAVAFLQQPTSTATGATEYANYLKKSYDLTDKEFKLMQDSLMDKIASVSDEKFLEQYLMQYKDFTGELETEAKDVSEQIESDAIRIQNNLDKDIKDGADKLLKAVNGVESQLNKILDSFSKFGL